MKTILLIAVLVWIFLLSGCAGYTWVGQPSTFSTMESGRPIWHNGGTIWIETDERKNRVRAGRR